jgi:type III pantothenate kinase
MLLAIDIGNSSIAIGIFDGEKLKATWRLATTIRREADEYGALVLAFFKQQKLPISKISGGVMCSVVPPVVPVFQEVCRKYLNILPLIVEAGVKTGIRLSVDNPRELGPDRVVNAVAAHHLYGGPAVVIDFGTATTFDVISKEGDYLGGAISPGVTISTEALFSRTAMLPRVELVRPTQVIGRNTISAMQSGIIFGYIGLVEGMINSIEQELGSKVKVIATGGYAYLLAKATSRIKVINRNLSLVGLRFIYEMNKKENSKS